ncbi:MAG: MBL fold metallo-hydrolase [Acidiferrobacterales bacterium]
MRIIFLGIVLITLTACTDKSAPANTKAINHSATRITEGLFVIHGPLDLPNKTNKGFMNNPGFVITNKGVVVIDPGSSRGTGEMVLREIKKISSQPVVAVFNSHEHGDHWLGNEAIKLAYPDVIIYGHENMKQAAETDGDNWVKIFKKATEGTMTPTKAVPPNKTVKPNEIIKVGGISFRIHNYGQAHTKGDIMVEVVEKKVLFVGDIALYKRMPRMNDASFKGNINSLNKALALDIKYYVPGHGITGGKEVITPFLDYLTLMRTSVTRLYDDSLLDYEMKIKMRPDFVAWQNWVDFPEEFGRHIGVAYLEVEKEEF